MSRFRVWPDPRAWCLPGVLASGQGNKDIARALHLSVATTRNHVQHILKKLDVHTKLQAMALVSRNGLVSAP